MEFLLFSVTFPEMRGKHDGARILKTTNEDSARRYMMKAAKIW